MPDKYRITAGFHHTHFGVPYEFPEGIVVKASSTCDPENGVANMDAEPPLVRKEFIEANPLNFKRIKTNGT